MTEAQEKLTKVLNSLIDIADAEARKSDSYKYLFETVESNDYGGLLRKLTCEMESLVLDAIAVIEDKSGKGVTDNIADILLALRAWKMTKHHPHYTTDTEHVCPTIPVLCALEKKDYEWVLIVGEKWITPVDYCPYCGEHLEKK